VSGTLLSLSEMWHDHPAMGLALDAAKGLRGGPILDDRGRFHGVLFHSLTGSASFSETGALQEFVKSL